jgi:hypothetical protein
MGIGRNGPILRSESLAFDREGDGAGPAQKDRDTIEQFAGG